MTERIGDRAVVLGGSMAGVLAARALSEHYGRVTVLERDQLPAPGVRRRGVPQDRHIHALQPAGREAIEGLFPGMTQELAAQGARIGDMGRHGSWVFAGNRIRSGDYGIELLTVSRPLLEGHLRMRLGQLPNVGLLDDCGVYGLVLDESGSRLRGVRVLRGRDGSSEEVLEADLVVDATGRGSRLPRWLEDAGYPAPDEDQTGLDVTYTTFRFPRRPTDDRNIIIVTAVPPAGRRGGGAIAVEGDGWVVTLGGVLGEQAPTDLAGFRDYAATLPVPDLHELVRDREPLNGAVVMRYPTGSRRRYERLDRFPQQLIVLGDALCSFNPVYGQGMSVAAAEAVALRDCLGAGVEGLGARFFRAIRPVVDDAWDMAANGDSNYVGDARSGLSPTGRLVGSYQLRMMQVAAQDPVVARAFLKVMGMVARPGSLLRPRVACRVLAPAWLRRGRSEESERPTRAPVGAR